MCASYLIFFLPLLPIQGYINEVDLLKNQFYTADALRSDMHNQLMVCFNTLAIFFIIKNIIFSLKLRFNFECRN